MQTERINRATMLGVRKLPIAPIDFPFPVGTRFAHHAEPPIAERHYDPLAVFLLAQIVGILASCALSIFL